MDWKFDQVRNAACITVRSVIDGAPVLLVTHYDDDHSWAFMDGEVHDTADGMVVAMSTVLDRHPELQEIAHIPPGWSATRTAAGQPWSPYQNDWDDED
ncbi:hypothetical protein OF829_14125 [Sphingomonas sp. LB-2]|uniref:hypothetical protein n=1 Tax=Sphingomonas caeni TaxID=2984949 RepID=UPI0022311F28|nr:hypothetical protein [Sphingomonas caeni]MCW3848377.1 hypothetical protein [Sphingomonas caeni]